MNSTQNKKPRRQQILEAFAHMLEASPGARITTAALAKQVGVSEAALYRHFPSKTKMFEGLIEFIEEAIFARVNIISSEAETSGVEKCEKILNLLLVFSERNPGITRILTGDALAGETERLHHRVVQFFDRLETHLRQILREAELRESISLQLSISATVNLWLAVVEGKIAQFVRGQFRVAPTTGWTEQWPYLVKGCIAEPA
ncbi:nucleoid occlusion factor SlmA [Saccharophagus sp. K07]|jgi:TetR/AcrR family transcriptional regulator|uniref:nucleoid occlusion factor SlmA n=1 Tax=Saccharophagus sp. K07 TaxID=2283636 RepID=UPI0016522D89|nr:nucleoid occlusion factor SlmA [Saccharophagus sp. K07]MBC6906201.1 nucleoid occlusion factor SlmA [Saccharophagus sp. K07]